CPHCKKQVQVPDQSIGKPVRCPGCKKVFTTQPAASQGPGLGPAASAGGSARTSESIEMFMPASISTLTAGGGMSCPACKADLPPGAVACMDCGFLLQADAGGPADEGAPNLCPNPACGAANPPGERTCQRCSSPLPTAPGTMINNRYRIEKQLAVGGFGAVYLATDTKDKDRKVAIKEMICPDPQEFAIRLNFFRREAEILRSMDGLPLVPRVFDFIEQGQMAYLVLEFIKGQDLLKIMEANDNKPFPLPQVIEWGKSVCDVLTHMHTQQPPLVHRDLKPDNIMLLENQKDIKMIDFGTARDIGRTQKERLAAKTRVYTEGYAPPEQIIGKPEPRSDLFALAGTLYHLATGKSPEGFHTAKEIEEQLKSANSSLPKEYRWFFELLKINLSEDVNDRYFSAKEFKADLEMKQVTKEVTCPKCKTVNKVREPYCSKCAHPLTDPTPPCHHCGKQSRMGSRCCIHCGNRLR
ncbi:MAG: protein kinase, partial [Gemmataceae bacterium]|nr:protein kinase [Gemmataceae bacterium]